MCSAHTAHENELAPYTGDARLECGGTMGRPMNEQEMGAERELVADVLSLSSRIQQHLQPDTPLEISGERRRQTAELREQIAEMRERIRRMRRRHLGR